MAILNDDLSLFGAKGMIGNLIAVHRTEAGLEVSASPPTQGEALSDAQRLWRAKLRVGIGCRSRVSFDCAVGSPVSADFLHASEIAEVDVSDYHGRIGDPIRLRVTPKAHLSKLGILITTGDNRVVECGVASRDPADPNVWTYQATQPAVTEHVKIVADAADLATVLIPSNTAA